MLISELHSVDIGLPLKKLFCIVLLLFIGTSVAIALIDTGMQTEVTPAGIVSYEFCGFTETCDAALAAWGEDGQARALLSLGLDYLYLFLYPGLVGLALLLLGAKLPATVVSLNFRARVIALCTTISLADALENYGLIRIILDGAGDPFGLFAGIFACIKFTTLGIALAWLLATALRVFLLSRRAS